MKNLSPLPLLILRHYKHYDMAGEDAAEVLAEVIDSYLEDAPKLLQAISAAVAQGDTTALYQAAHTLKPTSATLALSPSQICKDLEVVVAPALWQMYWRLYCKLRPSMKEFKQLLNRTAGMSGMNLFLSR